MQSLILILRIFEKCEKNVLPHTERGQHTPKKGVHKMYHITKNPVLSNAEATSIEEISEAEKLIDSDICPECGSSLKHQSGCKECICCGFGLCN